MRTTDTQLLVYTFDELIVVAKTINLTTFLYFLQSEGKMFLIVFLYVH